MGPSISVQRTSVAFKQAMTAILRAFFRNAGSKAGMAAFQGQCLLVF
jgi:hypothetical protein